MKILHYSLKVLEEDLCHQMADTRLGYCNPHATLWLAGRTAGGLGQRRAGRWHQGT